MKKKDTVRKNIGFIAVVSGALAAAIFGLAGPAAATTSSGFHHHHTAHQHSRVHDMQRSINVPHVDTSVHNGTVVCTGGTGCAVVSR